MGVVVRVFRYGILVDSVHQELNDVLYQKDQIENQEILFV
jgi:hypothetical protein